MAAPKTKRKKPVAKANKIYNWTHIQIIFFFMGVCGVATLFIGSGLAWFLSLDIPDIRSFADYKPLVATQILDKHGKHIDAIYKEYRIVVRYDAVKPLLARAFVAAEDSRYWEHAGLDSWSILRAGLNNLRRGRRSQGGSTITQQVTRALMLTREKSYFRKFTEAVLAYRLDRLLKKEDILAIYLNEIYLGEGAYGVESAARIYFSKKASSLNLAEIALLAGLPQSPSRYSPILHFKRAKARQRYVLNRMAEEGYITPDQAREAYQQKLVLNELKEQRQVNGYFTNYVRAQLEKRFKPHELYREGLIVTTTLDSKMQVAAINALNKGARAVKKRQKKSAAPQGALVALESATGRIVAMVGGIDYSDSPFNRVVQARRQPGSIFKAIVYAAAFERGISPQKIFYDAPLTLRNPDGTVWKPRNHSGKYFGATRLSDGLVYSRNIVSIKLLQSLGFSPVIDLAKQMGIHSPLNRELPLALGASNVSLLEMTGAYSAFANKGVYNPPTCITRVRGRNGKNYFWPGAGVAKGVISRKTASVMTAVLGEVITKGTGKKAHGIKNGAGKTGTTDDNRDAWFVGYSDQVTAGVWLGYDRGHSLGRGETGGQAAAPVWKEFMQSLNR